MSCAQLHGWQKSVTDFNSLFPVRFAMTFSLQDLFKRQSNKYLNLLVLIKCVIKAEKFNVTFYVYGILSRGKLETMEYIVVYTWKEYKGRNLHLRTHIIFLENYISNIYILISIGIKQKCYSIVTPYLFT